MNIKEEHFVLKNGKLRVYILLDFIDIRITNTLTDFRPYTSDEAGLWLDKICIVLS